MLWQALGHSSLNIIQFREKLLCYWLKIWYHWHLMGSRGCLLWSALTLSLRSLGGECMCRWRGTNQVSRAGWWVAESCEWCRKDFIVGVKSSGGGHAYDLGQITTFRGNTTLIGLKQVTYVVSWGKIESIVQKYRQISTTKQYNTWICWIGENKLSQNYHNTTRVIIYKILISSIHYNEKEQMSFVTNKLSE